MIKGIRGKKKIKEEAELGWKVKFPGTVIFFFFLLCTDPDTPPDRRNPLAPLFSSGKTFLSPSA